jgi:hypothetical protein
MLLLSVGRDPKADSREAMDLATSAAEVARGSSSQMLEGTPTVLQTVAAHVACRAAHDDLRRWGGGLA